MRPQRHYGRRSACTMPPRRFQMVLVLALGLLTLMYLASRTAPIQNSPTVTSIAHTAQEAAQEAASILSHKKIPTLWNPFGHAVHQPPPEQPNSTHAGTSWLSDYQWLNPFSSSVTLDDHRALLPVMAPRTTIYTFYDSKDRREKEVLEEEHRLLLTWRRAWWAQGFRPVVLGMPEAERNPLWEQVQRVNMTSEMRAELHRWLAWGHMKGGILANWLTLPMAEYNDPMLSFLRRGETERIMRYDSLRNGLFMGNKQDINDAVEKIILSESLGEALSPIDVLPKSSFKLRTRPSGVALYDLATIKSKFKSIAKELEVSEVGGLTSLRKLVNAHLQLTWQNSFPGGIAVLQHLPVHGNLLIEPSIEIARNLSHCLDSPVLKSCPPNAPSCTPCNPDKPFPITAIQSYQNSSKVFTIGVVPHPYLTTSLHYFKETLDTAFVRRNTTRDDWLVTISKNVVFPTESTKAALGGPQLLVRFKELVADEHEATHSLWTTPEKAYNEELEWIFGFPLAPNATDSKLPPPPDLVGLKPSADELMREQEIFELARVVVRGTHKEGEVTRKMVEAWNMADVEAWRFVTAFNARKRVERLRWEEEERAFAGSEDRVEGWGGWLDRKTKWLHKDNP